MKTSTILANFTCGLIIVLTGFITLFSIEQKKQLKLEIYSQESCLKTCSKTLKKHVFDIKNTVEL